VLKRTNLVTSPVFVGLVGMGVVGAAGGAVLMRSALRRRKAKKRLSAGSGLVVSLRPSEATLAGDAGLLAADFAEAVQAAMPAPAMVGPNGASGSVFEEGLRAMADGLDGVAPFGEPAFRQPDFREPDMSAPNGARWRPVRMSAPAPVVEPHPPGSWIPVAVGADPLLHPVGPPRRSNYRMKRARQWMVDRAKEDERWARFMGRKAAMEPGIRVVPSSLSTNEVERHDELSQLGQIEMEIFTDGRPSGEHGSVGVGRTVRAWMWFRMRVLGEKS